MPDQLQKQKSETLFHDHRAAQESLGGGQFIQRQIGSANLSPPQPLAPSQPLLAPPPFGLSDTRSDAQRLAQEALNEAYVLGIPDGVRRFQAPLGSPAPESPSPVQTCIIAPALARPVAAPYHSPLGGSVLEDAVRHATSPYGSHSVNENPWSQAAPAIYRRVRRDQEIEGTQHLSTRGPSLAASHPSHYVQGESHFGQGSSYPSVQASSFSQQTPSPGAGYDSSFPGQVAQNHTYKPRYTVAAARDFGQSAHSSSYVAPSQPQARPHNPAYHQPRLVPSFRTATPLAQEPVSVVSSLPGYDNKDVNAVEHARVSRNLNQINHAVVATPEKCIICKVAFGHENPHGPYYENVRQPSGQHTRVEINNLGAIENRVYLPCGHTVGNNCILPFSFCPLCRADLYYPECPHKIPPTSFQRIRKDFNKKCVECRILDYEHMENLSGLLAESVRIKALDAQLYQEARHELHPYGRHDRMQTTVNIANLRTKIDAVKAQTDLMIEEERQALSGYI